MDDLACRYTLWNRMPDLQLDGSSFMSIKLPNHTMLYSMLYDIYIYT